MKKFILLIILIVLLNLAVLFVIKGKDKLELNWNDATGYEITSSSSTSISGLVYNGEIKTIIYMKKANSETALKDFIPVYVEFDNFEFNLKTDKENAANDNKADPFISEDIINKVENSVSLIVFNKNGSIEKIYINPEIPEEISKSIQQLFYTAETIIPLNNNTKEWTDFSEFNKEKSELSFKYENGFIIKKRLNITKDSFDYKINNSEFKIRLSKNFWIDDAKGYETYEIKSPITDSLSGYMNIDFKSIPFNESSALNSYNLTFEEFLKEYRKQKSAIFDYRRNNPEISRDIIYSDNISKNITKSKDTFLKKFIGLKDNSNKSYFEMVGLLVSYPELMDSIPNLIKGYGVKEDNASRMMIGILEYIGTDKAQKTIAGILKDNEQSKINRMRAAVALNGVKSPTDGTIESLVNQINVRGTDDDKVVSDTSYLALGSVGSKLYNGESEKYLDIKNKILQDLNSGNVSKDIVLSSAGNTEDKSLYEPVSKYFNSEVTDEKIAAINSAGKLDNERFGKSASSLLENEKNQAVRSETYRVLIDNRDREVVDLMIKNIGTEEEVSRKSIINYFNKNIDIPEIENKAKEIYEQGNLSPSENIEIRKALRNKKGLLVD